MSLQPPDGATTTKVRTWVKVALALGCAAIAAMWIYYFVKLADEKFVSQTTSGPYHMEDPAWREAALPICAAATAEREALTDVSEGYISNPTHEQMLQRADLVDQATDILERMLADLVAIPVNNDNDRLRLEVFDENYRIVLSDRRRYTAELRAFTLDPYTETVVAGGPVSNVLTDFTAGPNGNDVPLCSPPGELGGDVQP